MNTPPDLARTERPSTSPPTPQRPWYLRWQVVAAAVAVVAIGASVLSDLPGRGSLSDRVAQVASVMRQINTDVHACAYATSQAFSIYRGVTNGTFPSAERSFVPKYLRDDELACTYSDQSIYSISTITVPNFSAGGNMTALISAVLKWSTSDAAGAVADIETLVKDPHDAAALGNLATRERLLASDRALGERQRLAAERTLSTARLPALGLPSLPVPPPATP